MAKPYSIQERTFEFAVDILSISRILRSHHEYDIARQLVRSGTSIGANVHEAGAAFSKGDFVYKMSIASKEARETLYWLRLIQRMDIPIASFTDILLENRELIHILTAIVKNAQKPS
jgi:four helix bundle protein